MNDGTKAQKEDAGSENTGRPTEKRFVILLMDANVRLEFTDRELGVVIEQLTKGNKH